MRSVDIRLAEADNPNQLPRLLEKGDDSFSVEKCAAHQVVQDFDNVFANARKAY
jgi:hypothetical protein